MTYVWSRDGVLYGQSVTRPFSSDCSTSVSKPAGNLWGQVYIEKWNLPSESTARAPAPNGTTAAEPQDMRSGDGWRGEPTPARAA